MKNVEKRVKDSLNRNFTKMSRLINETSAHQKEISSKMTSLETKTKTIQNVLKKKKKLKSTKRNASLMN